MRCRQTRGNASPVNLQREATRRASRVNQNCWPKLLGARWEGRPGRGRLRLRRARVRRRRYTPGPRSSRNFPATGVAARRLWRSRRRRTRCGRLTRRHQRRGTRRCAGRCWRPIWRSRWFARRQPRQSRKRPRSGGSTAARCGPTRTCPSSRARAYEWDNSASRGGSRAFRLCECQASVKSCEVLGCFTDAHVEAGSVFCRTYRSVHFLRL